MEMPTLYSELLSNDDFMLRNIQCSGLITIGAPLVIGSRVNDKGLYTKAAFTTNPEVRDLMLGFEQKVGPTTKLGFASLVEQGDYMAILDFIDHFKSEDLSIMKKEDRKIVQRCFLQAYLRNPQKKAGFSTYADYRARELNPITYVELIAWVAQTYRLRLAENPALKKEVERYRKIKAEIIPLQKPSQSFSYQRSGPVPIS